ncbi:MAG: hypothetical protein ACP5PX_00770 [Candidatus Hadarchaeum sp.]
MPTCSVCGRNFPEEKMCYCSECGRRYCEDCAVEGPSMLALGV